MTARMKPSCFPFFSKDRACESCQAKTRCKAILISHGFDVLGSLVDAMLNEIPDDAEFEDTDKISTLVQMLINPPRPGVIEAESELMRLAKQRTQALGIADI